MKLTTLTKEFFVPGFLERDEGEREKPYAKYPWDGVSGVKPFREHRGADDGGGVLETISDSRELEGRIADRRTEICDVCSDSKNACCAGV